VQILGVAFNSNASQLVREFISKYKPAFPVGYSTADAVYDYLQLSIMRINYVPIMAFIDRHGVIRAQHSGDSDFFRSDQQANIENVLDSLAKEPAQGNKPGSSKRKRK
jgi:hypothetical protein